MLSTPHSTPQPTPRSRLRSPRIPTLLGCLGLAALACLGLPPAAGAEPPSQPDAAEPAAAPAAGLRIYVDPQTGELTSTPTREQAERLSAALAPLLERPVEEPVLFEIPSGGTGVYVGRRFASAVMVRVRADGTFELGCADPDHAHELLAAPPAPGAESPTAEPPAYAVK